MLTPGDYEMRAWARRMPVPEEMKDLKEIEKEREASKQWSALKGRLRVLTGEGEEYHMYCARNDVFRPVEEDVQSYIYKVQVNGQSEKKILIKQRCYQHTLASMTSRFLHSQYAAQDPSTPTIDIYAYDPYTQDELLLLENFSAPISIVSDLHHYLAVTPSSLVIEICCPNFVPKYETMADLLHPSGLAAWLMCEFMDDFPWFAKKKVDQLDDWTPRVGKLMELYEKEDLWELGWEKGDEERPWSLLQFMFLYTRDDGRVQVESSEEEMANVSAEES